MFQTNLRTLRRKDTYDKNVLKATRRKETPENEARWLPMNPDESTWLKTARDNPVSKRQPKTRHGTHVDKQPPQRIRKQAGQEDHAGTNPNTARRSADQSQQTKTPTTYTRERNSPTRSRTPHLPAAQLRWPRRTTPTRNSQHTQPRRAPRPPYMKARPA